MFRNLLLLSIVGVSLAQWVDPDYSSRFGDNYRGMKRYPPLPGSVQLFDEVEDTKLAAVTTPKPTSPPVCQSMFGCSDCNTAQVCLPDSSGNLVQRSTMACPSTSPYCDYSTGTCGKVADSRCGATDQFLCSSNGYFPDPTNCSIYHVCNNYKASKFACVQGQHYDADNRECDGKIACESSSCSGQAQIKVPIGETQYYAYCRNGSPFVVSKCQGEYKLNATSQNCEPMCTEDGLMADADICTSFYKCSSLWINASLSVNIREHFDCPTGEAFQPSSYQCVPKTLTDCKS